MLLSRCSPFKGGNGAAQMAPVSRLFSTFNMKSISFALPVCGPELISQIHINNSNTDSELDPIVSFNWKFKLSAQINFFLFFFLAVRTHCAHWAYSYIISGAGVVSGIPHPAV